MPRTGWICDAPRGDALREARVAEAAGLDVLVLLDRGGDDLWGAVEAVARATRMLGLLVVSSAPVVADPLAFAAGAARTARLAPGRIELGLEVGSPARDGHPLLNWERMSRMGRVLPAVRDLLAGREVHVAGPHLTFDGGLGETPSHPLPIWMLADGPSSAGMAASLADGVIVEAAEGVREEVLDPFRAAARDAPVAVLVRAGTVRAALAATAAFPADLLAVRTEGDVDEAMRELAT